MTKEKLVLSDLSEYKVFKVLKEFSDLLVQHDLRVLSEKCDLKVTQDLSEILVLHEQHDLKDSKVQCELHDLSEKLVHKVFSEM